MVAEYVVFPTVCAEPVDATQLVREILILVPTFKLLFTLKTAVNSLVSLLMGLLSCSSASISSLPLVVSDHGSATDLATLLRVT